MGKNVTAEVVLQKAVRARLVATPEVTALVPAGSILDRNERPNPRPSIVIGEGISRDEGDSIARNLTRVWLDLHVWMKEVSTIGVKLTAGAVRTAVRYGPWPQLDGFLIVDCYVESVRFLRDPDGETSHAVITINAKVQEL